MFDISPIQILIVLVIALLVFGPKRLPEMGKSIGRGIREFKTAIADDDPAPAPAPPTPAAPAAPAATASSTDSTTATVSAAVADESDDDVLEGVVVPGDTPPRPTDA